MINKEIGKFLYKLILFLLLVIFLDYCAGVILEKMYFSVPRKITYAINNSEEEILIFGSSKANRQYDPGIFRAITGKTCFNNGLDGRNIFYHYALFASVVERHTPEIVILDLLEADYSVTDANWDTDRLNTLLPYHGQNKYIDEVLGLRSDFERIKLLSSIYPFNSAIIDIIKTRILNKDLSFGHNGYLPVQPLGGVTNGTELYKFENKAEPDPLKVAYLRKIIRICKEKDITLIIILSPWYSQGVQKADLLDEIAASDKVIIWNYTHHELFSEIELFSDVSHLNESGAKKYSEMVAKKILKEIIQKMGN